MLVVLSVALVALATVLLVLGLVTDGGLALVVGSIVASGAAGVALLKRRPRRLISSG